MYPAFIIWNPDPFIIEIGRYGLRWYGFLFAAAFILSRYMVFHMYRKEGKAKNRLDYLLIYMISGVVIGARLGHILFYEPQMVLSRPLEIFNLMNGGLSAHGCVIGIFLAVWFYLNKITLSGGSIKITPIGRQGHNWRQVLDRMVIVMSFGAVFIRVGDFINGEIVGKPTHANYGIIFAGAQEEYITQRVPVVSSIEVIKNNLFGSADQDPVLTLKVNFSDKSITGAEATEIFQKNVLPLLNKNQKVPHLYSRAKPWSRMSRDSGGIHFTTSVMGVVRHPSQLYEAAICLIVFIILFRLWSKMKKNTPPGYLLGLFLILVFGLRIIEELIKENQVSFEDSMIFNMGQLLSVPFVLFGIYLFLLTREKAKQMR